jgi:hypothetical protein
MSPGPFLLNINWIKSGHDNTKLQWSNAQQRPSRIVLSIKDKHSALALAHEIGHWRAMRAGHPATVAVLTRKWEVTKRVRILCEAEAWRIALRDYKAAHGPLQKGQKKFVRSAYQTYLRAGL